MLGGLFVELQYTATFQKRLALITPAIVEQHEEVLLARWAGMMSIDDYRNLNKEIESIARNNSIFLPDPLLD
jgi:hypothetical protein